MAKDKRIDAYIAKSPEFAKPILNYVRTVVHETCPDAEETLKWNMPTFMYKGILCGMAAFKQHAAFGFWKSKLVLAKNGRPADASWGHFGRITRLSDLPSRKVLAGYVSVTNLRRSFLTPAGAYVASAVAASGKPRGRAREWTCST